MSRFRVNITLTEDDFIKYSRVAGGGVKLQHVVLTFVSSTLTLIMCLLAIRLVENSIFVEWTPWSIAYVAVVSFLIFNYLFSKFIFFYAPVKYVDPDGGFLRAKEISIDEKGIYENWQFGSYSLQWPAVIKINEADEFIFIFIDKMQAFVVPKRSFQSSEEAQLFATQAKSFWEAAKIHPRDTGKSKDGEGCE